MRRRLVAAGVAMACAATVTAAVDPAVAGASASALMFTPASTASTASADWAGWDVTGGTYRSVSAKWTEPKVTCAAGSDSSSAFWVGLDGDTSTSVEQTGTEANCVDGTAQYDAWYEFYPSPSVNLAEVVKAGDVMTASVSASRTTGAYTLTVRDLTRGWTHTQHGTAAAGTNASAEVIAEAPTDSRTGSVVSLADFGRATFRDVQVNGRAIGTVATPKRITMTSASETFGVAPAQTVLATTSALSADDRFSVTWKSAGSPDSTPTTGDTGPGGDSGGWPSAPDPSGSWGWGTGAGDRGAGGYGWAGGYGSYGGYGWTNGYGY